MSGVPVESYSSNSDSWMLHSPRGIAWRKSVSQLYCDKHEPDSTDDRTGKVVNTFTVPRSHFSSGGIPDPPASSGSPSPAEGTGAPLNNAAKPIVILHDPFVESSAATTSSSNRPSRGRLRNLDWTCTGDKVLVAASTSVLVTNAKTLACESTLPIQSLCIAAHHTSPHVFCSVTNKGIVQIHDCRQSVTTKVTSQSSTAGGSSSATEQQQAIWSGPFSQGRHGSQLRAQWSLSGNQLYVTDNSKNLTIFDSRLLKSHLASADSSRIAPSRNNWLRTQSTLRFAFDAKDIAIDPHDDSLFYASNTTGKVSACHCRRSESQNMVLDDTQVSLRSCNSLCVDSLGRYVLVSCGNDSVSLLDANDLSCIRSLSNLGGRVSKVDFAKGGSLAACCGEPEADDRSPAAPFISLLNVDPLHVLWSGYAAGTPWSLRWSPRDYIFAYCYDSSGSRAPGSFPHNVAPRLPTGGNSSSSSSRTPNNALQPFPTDLHNNRLYSGSTSQPMPLHPHQSTTSGSRSGNHMSNGEAWRGSSSSGRKQTCVAFVSFRQY